MSRQVSNNKIADLFKSRKNILSHLNRQNYITADYYNFSLNEINSMYQTNQMDMLVTNESSKKKVYVKYYLDEKANRNTFLDKIIEDLFINSSGEDETSPPLLERGDTLVIILSEEPNDTLISKIKYIYENQAQGYYIIPIAISRLLFNIFECNLVPKHEILTDEEVQELVVRYNLRGPLHKVLPEVSRRDPVSIMLFLRPGQVVRINRDSVNAGEVDFYRVCV
jgi:DNA-directed RNA polymerase subunit H (RpoH/RPB5)